MTDTTSQSKNDRIRTDEVLDAVRKIGVRIQTLAVDIDRTQTFSREAWQIVCDLGIPSLPFQESDGGLGCDQRTFVAAVEELAFHGAGVAVSMGATVQVVGAILRFGDKTQRQIAVDMLKNGKLGAWAFTEPQTGSDPKQIMTKAVRDGDGWVLNGTKMFTSGATYAHTVLVFARTTEENRLGAFIVDTSNPGWRPGKPLKMLCFGGQGAAPVTIDNLRLGPEALLGAVDQGFQIMIATEAESKIRASAVCVGIGQRALAEATRYALDRKQRDTSIGHAFPTIQAHLGTMSASIDSARALVRAAADAIDDPKSPNLQRLAASARIVSARMAREVTSDALEICGSYGLTQDMVLERLYREGKFYEVGQGVIDLQRIIVGKQRLKQYADKGNLFDD